MPLSQHWRKCDFSDCHRATAEAKAKGYWFKHNLANMEAHFKATVAEMGLQSFTNVCSLLLMSLKFFILCL